MNKFSRKDITPVAIIFLLLFIGLSLKAKADNKNILSQIERLETKLASIENASPDIPIEELDKSKKWIEDAKNSMAEGSEENTAFKKTNQQIEFLSTLLEESRSKKKADELEQLIQKIRIQTEEITDTNAKVIEEIERLEQQ